jgi:septum formation protein
MDKAGGYGIQEKGGLFMENIEGDYFNVVGLPIFAVAKVLKEFGVDITKNW